jgi:ketosteroid isomerase-like protein
MVQRSAKPENDIKEMIEAWADAVRRHDLSGIVAHHDPDILMFDVPPPLQSRGMTSTRKRGTSSSSITSRHKPSTLRNSQ